MSRKCDLCGHTHFEKLINKNGFDLVKCKKCNLVFVFPQPSDKTIKDLYSFKKGYKFHHNFPLFENRLKMIMKFKKRGKLLDVGCSTGEFLLLAKKYKWNVYGVEISEDAEKIAKNKHKLNVFIGTLEDAKYPSKFFDVISLGDVIEHVKSPAKFLSEINRILKDDGIIFISTPNINSFFPNITHKIFRRFNGEWPHPKPPHHLFEFSDRTIKELLYKKGFVISKLNFKRIGFIHTIDGIYLIKMRLKKLFKIKSIKIILELFYLISLKISFIFLYFLDYFIFLFTKRGNTMDMIVIKEE